VTSPEPTAPAAPLLGEEAAEAVALASARTINGPASDGKGWYRSDAEHQLLLADARVTCVALEPLVAALVAEQRKAEYESAYREAEEVARQVDPDLEGYSVRDLANNMRLALEGRAEDVAAKQRKAEREQCARQVDAMVAKHASEPDLTEAERWDSQLVQIALDSAARGIRDGAS
jgi:hypothetical protein